MMDLRLKKMTLELDGKIFELCCNFNVLADIDELHGGLGTLLKSRSALSTARVFLSCMMNDYAESRGWPERYTPRQAGRLLPTEAGLLNKTVDDIMDLVFSAVRSGEDVSDPDTGGAAEDGDPEKN